VAGEGAGKVYFSSLYCHNNMKEIFVIMAASFFVLSACDNGKKDEKNDKKETAISTGESKQERNKKVIMASMEAFNNNEMDNVFKDVAPGYIDYTDGTMPPITVVDSLKEFYKMLKGSIPDYKGENHMYLADGDQVAVVADWGGTFQKDLMGIKASGKTFKYKDVDIFKMNDEGKITEHRSVANFPMVLQNSK
jgi:predicted ester cyclase